MAALLKTEVHTHPLYVYGVSGDSLWAEIKSSHQAGLSYRIAVRLKDGAVACECPWFGMKCKWGRPTIYSGDVCRHIRTYREFLQRELHDLKDNPAMGNSGEQNGNQT